MQFAMLGKMCEIVHRKKLAFWDGFLMFLFLVIYVNDEDYA